MTQDIADCEPTPELVEEDRRQPIQYIKNIKDGTDIGYKYFAFDGLHQVSMQVRGKAEGSIAVSIDTLENQVGSIPVCVDSGEWRSVSGKTEFVEGTHALYFRFEGEGEFDFVTFTME